MVDDASAAHMLATPRPAVAADVAAMTLDAAGARVRLLSAIGGQGAAS